MGEQVERHDGPVEEQDCHGQWCCGCDEHPIGKPWGWNWRAWERHYAVCPKKRPHSSPLDHSPEKESEAGA